jgi:mono/diheme cytochrome c family protein
MENASRIAGPGRRSELIPIKVAAREARHHYAARRPPGREEERTMRKVAAVAMLTVLVAGAARAEDDAPESGKDVYLRHCAVCHGIEGFGNGPLADAMKIAPSDLTRIAAKHGAEFPAAKVSDVIRNGGGVLGHGSPAMPAWGSYFSEKRKPEAARARVKALVDYIESIQAK